MTDHNAEIAAAEAELAAARADVTRLQAKLADQLAQRAAVHGAAAGRAEAAQRYGKKPATDSAATNTAADADQDGEHQLSAWDRGRAEARKRYGNR